MAGAYISLYGRSRVDIIGTQAQAAKVVDSVMEGTDIAICLAGSQATNMAASDRLSATGWYRVAFVDTCFDACIDFIGRAREIEQRHKYLQRLLIR